MKINCMNCNTLIVVDFDDKYDVDTFCPNCGCIMDNSMTEEVAKKLMERIAIAEDEIKNGKCKTSEEVFKDMEKKIRQMNKRNKGVKNGTRSKHRKNHRNKKASKRR